MWKTVTSRTAKELAKEPVVSMWDYWKAKQSEIKYKLASIPEEGFQEEIEQLDFNHSKAPPPSPETINVHSPS